MEGVTFSPEQFDRLIEAIKTGREPVPAGLGATPRVGIGSGDAGMGPLEAGVWAMLAAGSPRLALAKAKGVPLAPFIVNVRATFPDVDTVDVLNVGSDVKIVQDTLVDALVTRITIDNTPQNVFQPQSDFFFNFQSGLEVTLDVKGAPRYSVAEKFTPISTLADMVNGTSKWPGGWILTYQQQLFMSFHARITLPDAPVTVVCTYRGWVPVNDEFVQMTNREAFAQLSECGITCSEAYTKRVCR